MDSFSKPLNDSDCVAKAAFDHFQSVLDDVGLFVADAEALGCRASGDCVGVVARIQPSCLADVQLAVRAAADSGVALHPISRGCNWGYGAASPPVDGQAVLDLSSMNRILEVNQELGYAVIEPGVSQGQLSEHLAENFPEWWLDATGAGPNASVVGNTMDRGFGHTPNGDHLATVAGLEVVLGDGRVIDTGFGHWPGAKAKHVYRYGIGPFLDGMFSQGSFGVVTKLTIWLVPKPDVFSAFLFRLPNDTDLDVVIEKLAPLRREGTIKSALHIANDLRVLSARTRYPWDLVDGTTPLDESARAKLRKRYGSGVWNGLGAIQGPKRVVKAAQKEIRKAMKPYSVIFLDDTRLKLARRIGIGLKRVGIDFVDEQVKLIDPVVDLLKGKPNREHLKGTAWRVRGEIEDDAQDPLTLNAGLMWVSPITPMTGRDARGCLDVLEPIYRKHGFDPLVTFTMINERAMVCVTNIAFDRRLPEECAAAKACYGELMTSLKDVGYLPYRSSPSAMEYLVDEDDTFWHVVEDLKKALDPAGIISPGRYCKARTPDSSSIEDIKKAG